MACRQLNEKKYKKSLSLFTLTALERYENDIYVIDDLAHVLNTRIAVAVQHGGSSSG